MTVSTFQKSPMRNFLNVVHDRDSMIAKLLAVRKLRRNFKYVSNVQKTDFWVHDREIFFPKNPMIFEKYF